MVMCVLLGWRGHGNDRGDGGGDGDHGNGSRPLHDDALQQIHLRQFQASSHPQHGLLAS